MAWRWWLLIGWVLSGLLAQAMEFRNHHVRADPPAPAYTGFDSIQLGLNIDVCGVQALLNACE